MKNKKILLFFLIALVAFFLRFYQLNKFPVALNWDEVSHGYNAYSLISTGKDQWSTSWPIFNFRAYGDYPTTLNMYLSMPFIYFFGINEWTIRMVSALCGFGLVIVAYFLGQEIFKNKNKSFLLMFLVTISPWTFFPSRGVFQSTVAQFFFSLGLLFLIKAIKKIKFLPLGIFFFSISTYAYHNSKIVVPILLLIYFIIFFKELKQKILKNKKFFIISLLILSVLIIPQLINNFNKDAQARSRWVFVINPASINVIENNRNNYQGSQLVAKLKYNRATLFTTTVTQNYLNFLNPKILFFNSTQNYQFNIPGEGVLYSVCLPFFYIGLIIIILKSIKSLPFFKGRCPKDGGVFIFLIFWFLIGLAPAVVTTGDFPIIRAMSILPLPQIFIVYGFFKTISFLKNPKTKTIFTILFLIILIIQSFSYFKNYFNNYAQNYSSSWQYGYKETVNYIKENYSSYDQIIFTKKYGEAHEFVLFYWPWNPSSYQADSNLNWDFHADWYWVNAFDKFKFVNDWEIQKETESVNKKTLLITSPGNYNKSNNTLLIKTIYFLNQQPAFDILIINDQK
ncbi:MAG: glycosyltransferase family 39 protein [Candidatus Shapirobacteria bacterium]|nr:glycosyltransferase family 39 protein [Candidatus Shapirobacteria bacterium]MDD3002465.1 glycosyltransferase family 39 protein [Candidatus Shapirobacteria bacterium]MDD4383346.1 glycosyltransferase family 39 protein [Candidatus Shapirobacteria bacterium]